MENRTQLPPYGLRMRPELKEKIVKSAKDADRSMNMEICYRLAKSYEAGEPPEESEKGN